MEVGVATTFKIFRSSSSVGLPVITSNRNSPRRKPSSKRYVSNSTQATEILPQQHSTLFKEQTPLNKLYINNMNDYRNKVAIVDKDGDFLYEDVYRRSYDLAKCIQDILKSKKLDENHHRISFLCPHGISYVITQWACWMGGNVAVPLSASYNVNLLEHIIKENGSKVVITSNSLVSLIQPVIKNTNIQLIVLDATWRENPVKSIDRKDLDQPLPTLYDEEFYKDLSRDALVLYSNGTRSNGIPRGVKLNHLDINNRINGTSVAWNLSSDDNILHALPLNSNYGVINALNAPLSHGGKIVMLNNLDSVRIWSHLLGIGVDSGQSFPKINFFPSMPSIYCTLIERHRDLFHSKKMREYVKQSTTKKIRVMTSSCSAMPQSILDKWKAITGHNIIEIYSSTEVGTGLSGQITKPSLVTRKHEATLSQCGTPLPGVQTRIVRFIDQDKTSYDTLGEFSSYTVSKCNESSVNDEPVIVGELMIKGPGMVTNYIDDDSKQRTYDEGWYLTGDIVKVTHNGCHKIIGRISASTIQLDDNKIIITKDIEMKLMSHPAVSDCCVVGISDSTINNLMAHKLAAFIVLEPSSTHMVNKFSEIMDWYKDNLEDYEIPSVIKILPELPHDKLGRVDKLSVAKQAFDQQEMPVIYISDNKF